MSDLYIEARLQAIKDTASASCSDIKDADNIAGFCDEIYNSIPKLDKIISQLEDYGNEEIDYYRNTPYENCIRECVSKAIEIVKQGSASDDTDAMCEWKVFDNSLTNEPQWVYETTCGKYLEEEHTSKAFVYCPYCSKKIKAVK